MIKWMMVVSLLAVSIYANEPTAVNALKRDELVVRLQDDARAVQTYRDGLQAVVTYCRHHPELFPQERVKEFRSLNRESKEALWSAWKQFLEYSMALDSLRTFYARYFLIKDSALRAAAFDVMRTAFLAQYRSSLELIRILENDPGVDVILDDEVPELGVPKNAYTKCKVNFLNPARATEFAALEAVAAIMPKEDDAAEKSRAADAAVIWEMGKKEGHLMTADNALDVLRVAGSAIRPASRFGWGIPRYGVRGSA